MIRQAIEKTTHSSGISFFEVYEGVKFIFNNIIRSGQAPTNYCIRGRLVYSHISNNILLAENSGTTEIYIFYWDDVEHLLIQNNGYWSIDGAAGIVLSEGNTVLGPDNRIVNPYLSDPSSQDYSFSEQSPYALTEGGMDLSDYFTIDLNGNSRSVSWSMGAYEGR